MWQNIVCARSVGSISSMKVEFYDVRPLGGKGRYSLGIWYSFREDFRDRLFNFPDTVEAEICSQTCHVFGIRPSPFLSLFLLPPHPLHQICVRPGSLLTAICATIWKSSIWFSPVSQPSLPFLESGRAPGSASAAFQAFQGMGWACLVHCGAQFFWGLHLK